MTIGDGADPRPAARPLDTLLRRQPHPATAARLFIVAVALLRLLLAGRRIGLLVRRRSRDRKRPRPASVPGWPSASKTTLLSFETAPQSSR